MFFEEERLLQELRSGNRDAYREIYSNSFSGLCSYICSYTGNRQQAEDIVQQVMVRFWEKRETLPQVFFLRKYLYRSCYHEFLNSLRQQKKFSPLDQLNFSVYEEDIDLEADFENKLSRVNDLINSLPKKCKEVFVLRKIEGLGYKEIAQKLSISEKTVENHIGQALKKIRQNLKTS